MAAANLYLPSVQASATAGNDTWAGGVNLTALRMVEDRAYLLRSTIHMPARYPTFCLQILPLVCEQTFFVLTVLCVSEYSVKIDPLLGLF